MEQNLTNRALLARVVQALKLTPDALALPPRTAPNPPLRPTSWPARFRTMYPRS